MRGDHAVSARVCQSTNIFRSQLPLGQSSPNFQSISTTQLMLLAVSARVFDSHFESTRDGKWIDYKYFWERLLEAKI